MNKRIVMLGVVMLAAMVVVGCSRTQTIKTDEGEITFNEKGKNLTMKFKTDEGKDINIKVGEGDIPSGFPTDVPIYKPSTVASSQMMGDKNFVLSLTTGDDTNAVKTFYENQLTKQGWTIGNRMTMGPAAVMSSTKGGKELNVTINRDDENTIIALVVAEE